MWSRDLSSTNPSSPDPGGDECEAHDGVRDAEGEADHGDHPDHHVAVQADPHHGDQERHHEPQCRLRYMSIMNRWKHDIFIYWEGQLTH